MSTLVIQSTSLKSLVTRQLVGEFRAKMRQTEDLIAKLGYSLRELQDAPSEEPTPTPPKRTTMSAKIAQIFKRK